MPHPVWTPCPIPARPTTPHQTAQTRGAAPPCHSFRPPCSTSPSNNAAVSPTLPPTRTHHPHSSRQPRATTPTCAIYRFCPPSSTCYRWQPLYVPPPRLLPAHVFGRQAAPKTQPAPAEGHSELLPLEPVTAPSQNAPCVLDLPAVSGALHLSSTTALCVPAWPCTCGESGEVGTDSSRRTNSYRSQRSFNRLHRWNPPGFFP